MNTRLSMTLFAALLAGAVGLAGNAIAAPKLCDDGSRPPCGGGGGGAAPPDYGDLIILYRDPSGKPITTLFTEDPEGGMCQQPIAFPDNLGCPADGFVEVEDGEVLLVPVDPSTCGIDMAYAACTNEADFGRTNLARSSDEVLASQLDDVIINLAVADCTSLDPAGRLVYSSEIGSETMTGTIDSPLQNLAVYKELMLNGTIGPDLPQGATALDTAARGFGVAMDKAGEVNIDLLVYLNETLGLTEGTTILGEPVCVPVREEVTGEMQIVEKCFLNYGPHEEFPGYSYDRATNFGALPSPAYIPGEPAVAIDGWFEFLKTDDGGLSYYVEDGPILQTVFSDGAGGFEAGFTDGNIGGFAQAADDTRAVINFMHNWPVPADGDTEVPCTPTADPTDNYDLSISEQSGLQVPKQIVAGTEGREFTVSVANGGPDFASGTLTVTAVQGAGGDVLVNGVPGPFIFVFEGLLPGVSYATTQHFTIAEPHENTTILWTATVVPVDVDPYLDNNEVTATSNVRLTTGGGGH